jgi:O-antigen/teichoic acid export membrane protein
MTPGSAGQGPNAGQLRMVRLCGPAEDGAPQVGGAVRSALTWNVANQLVTQAVSACVFFFLAWELDPVAFGLIAMAALVADGFAVEAKTAAVDLLLIRRDFSPRFLATAFYGGCALAGLAWAAMAVLSRVVAAETGVKELPSMIAALGISVALAPLGAVYEALALKDLRFRALGARAIVASLVSAVAAVGAVLLGAGYWALVVQRVVASASGVLFLSLTIRWFPPASFDRRLAGSLAPDFLKLWSSQLLNFALGRVLDLVVGARLGVETLGFYRVANRLIELVQAAFTAPLTSVFVPLLSQYPSTTLPRWHYRELCALASLVIAPSFAGLALISDDLVHVLLGDRYEAAGSALRLLALGGLLAPFTYFRSVALIARNRPGLAAGLGLADLAMTMALAWTATGFGLDGVLMATLVAGVVAAAVTTELVCRVLALPPSTLVGNCLPPYLGVLVIAAAVLLGSEWLSGLTAAVRLPLLIPAGALAYAAYLISFHRRWLGARIAYLTSRGEGPAQQLDLESTPVGRTP